MLGNVDQNGVSTPGMTANDAQDPSKTLSNRDFGFLEAAIRLAGYVVHPLKLGFDVPRPLDYDPRAMPIIQTPTHASCCAPG